mmetsp:Transcript_9709/g.9416  ORF Transcript_9709/g.9416 Transcript_9709/m.9416 type:complete len:98 (+) Transcript_9709:201-494(+)
MLGRPQGGGLSSVGYYLSLNIYYIVTKAASASNLFLRKEGKNCCSYAIQETAWILHSEDQLCGVELYCLRDKQGYWLLLKDSRYLKVCFCFYSTTSF